MKREIVMGYLVLLAAVLLGGCEKNEVGNNLSDVPVKEDYVMLYEDMTANDKSQELDREVTDNYDFTLQNVSGNLYVTLSESGKLLRSGLTMGVYNELVKKVSDEQLTLLPGKILYETGRMLTLGYDYWNQSQFMPPMSKKKFDELMTDCENRSTNAGVVLCAVRVFTQALVDCIEAEQEEVDIHCW